MSWVFDEEVLAVILAIAVVTAVFAISQSLFASRVIEPFSELGLLGPSGKIGDYPRDVVAGSPLHLNIYIGNYEGRVIYYRVLVKLGGNSSTINASMPLDAEPLMDVRVILGHNSSRIIPINVTLYEIATNARLVFEMWIYNESANAFRYYGRWNQIWINVTRPSTPISPQQIKVLSPEIEPKIVEAYLAIRRAEDAGGEVSEMVSLLNLAIEHAYKGDLSDAQSLLDEVISLEIDVARIGLETGRIRFLTSVGSIIALSSIAIALYIYLRSNIWLLWAKAHKGWKVIWSNYERKTKGSAKLSNELKVEDLIRGPAALNSDTRKAARELHRMVRSRIIKIVDPNPPKDFPSYLIRYNLCFISALVMLVLGIACVYLSEGFRHLPSTNGSPLLSALFAAVTFIRYALGGIIVLFLPGYSLVEALYPDESGLSPIERLALSIGLSLALVPLVGLVLNYTPWGIRLNPIIFSLAILIISLLLISAYRKFSLFKVRLSA